jgi:hypothetical protein
VRIGLRSQGVIIERCEGGTEIRKYEISYGYPHKSILCITA